MGKNKRTKHFAREKALREQKQKNIAKHQRKKTRKKVLRISLVALLITAMVVIPTAMIMSARRDSGNAMRNVVVAETDNIQVNGAMFTFHFYDILMQTVSANLHSYTNRGLSLDLNLRRVRDPLTNLIWFDYFMARALDSIENILIFAQAAYVAGITLTEHDQRAIDIIIAEKQFQAEVRRISFDTFIFERFGRGVNEQDIRDYLQIYLLHRRMFQYIIADIDVSKEVATNWFYQNIENFMFVDVVSIDIGFPWFEPVYYFENLSPAERANLIAERYALAQTFASAETPSQFEDMAIDYFRQVFQDAGRTFTSVDVAEHLDMVNETIVLSSRTDNPISEWMLDADRAEGDYFISQSEITGVVTVYYIARPLYRHEERTHDVREIFIDALDFPSLADAEDYARELWERWESGTQTEARFSEYAGRYNRLPYLAARNGLRRSIMWHDDDESDPLFYVANWAYGANRRSGESELIFTTGGFHIVFYVGEGFAVWQVQAADVIQRSSRWEILDTYIQRFMPYVNERAAGRNVARLR
ncbi:MAG: hypothetical protein FWB93_05575 [Oscillospiraceae bacterium]|nr:hypothetical protein [Oscillospiraceae bacterium]